MNALALLVGGGASVAGVVGARSLWGRAQAELVRARLGAAGAVRPARNRSVACLPLAQPPRWVAARFDAMAVGADPGRVWRRAGVAVGVLVASAAVAGGPVLAIVVLLALGGTGALVLDLQRDRADRLADAGLPGVLDRTAAGLRAGLGLPAALAESVPSAPAPVRRDLVAVTTALEAGMPLARCLDRWRARRPTAGTRLATTALSVCAQTGGRSHPLDGVASSLRDRLAVDREVRAVSAQVRASAAVLVALPWAFLAFSAAQDTGVIGFFSGSVPGVACLLAGLLLDLGGGWIMARTLRSVR